MCLTWLWRLVSGEEEEPDAGDGPKYRTVAAVDEVEDLEAGEWDGSSWGSGDEHEDEGGAGRQAVVREQQPDESDGIEMGQVEAGVSEASSSGAGAAAKDAGHLRSGGGLNLTQAAAKKSADKRPPSPASPPSAGDAFRPTNAMELFDSVGLSSKEIVASKRVKPTSSALAAAAASSASELEEAGAWDLGDVDLDLGDSDIEDFLNSD